MRGLLRQALSALVAVVEQGTHVLLVEGFRRLFREVRPDIGQIEADFVALGASVHLHHIVVAADSDHGGDRASRDAQCAPLHSRPFRVKPAIPDDVRPSPARAVRRVACQPALNIDPRSASKIDPPAWPVGTAVPRSIEVQPGSKDARLVPATRPNRYRRDGPEGGCRSVARTIYSYPIQVPKKALQGALRAGGLSQVLPC
jgi:hypothetical protein